MTDQVVTIRDEQAGTSAEVAVHLGFNCFRFTATHAGKPVDVLYAHPEFTAGTQRPSGSGIPILFPFPGRIAGTVFTWEGRKYQLEPGDALGNAIHGFVMRRPWRVVEQGRHFVAGEFHAWRDDPSLKDRWPADFLITARYEVSAGRLACSYRLANPGPTPLPFGFGIHPYFRVPLGGPAAGDCVVRLPVSERWELAEMIPTGRRVAVSPTEGLSTGRRLAELKLDDVFTGIIAQGDKAVATLHDPAGATAAIRFGVDSFRECVVYTPPHGQAICIEPLTCAPGAAALAERGIYAGWRVLEPGDELTANVTISLE